MSIAIILVIVGIGSVYSISSIEKARTATAQVLLNEYTSNFTSALSDNAGCALDRYETWGLDGSGYTTEKSMSRVIMEVNKLLDTEKKFKWDPSLKAYIGAKDPWGGYIILTEYPSNDSMPGYDYYDPRVRGEYALSFSLWCSGKTNILKTAVPSSKDIGCLCLFTSGNFYSQITGIGDFSIPADLILKFK